MKIIKSITWIFFANLLVSITKWLIVVLIAQFLIPEEVGKYSLAFAISAPITLFANMKLRSLYITENMPSFSEYIYVRNILSLLAFIILFLIAILVYPPYFSVIMLVGLSKILDLQSDMYYAIPHKNGKMDAIGKIMIIKHLLTLVTFSCVLLISKNLILSLSAQLITQILFLVLIEKKHFRGKYDGNVKDDNITKSKETIKNIILLGLPLGFVQMLVSFNTVFPRYLLEHFEPIEILGYFSAIIYILTIGNMMLNAISQIFLPSLSNKIAKNELKSFKKTVFVNLTIFSSLLGLIIIIFSLMLGESFLTIVYGSEYGNYTDILILMSCALAINFVSWNFDTALLSMRYISIQPKITTFILLINLFTSYYLIKNFGISGAAYTLIIINLIQLILRVYFVNKRLGALAKTS
ncbi:oligosaccharide flippase family protein [Alkalihalophilus lindianensis]|uniref:Oligosaccharide flippase family protein n=1 Tax=Alkalihalophilus lindianensis TaxID=1630542 RepID=A0ABU3XAT5_9BACI|nr:oligosaccharide flippase family protein [Alkalihalophilus lindianensis]MDV2684408.1 oligosaccharide flippase family protein [Alkalihalophilus lindianensis]